MFRRAITIVAVLLLVAGIGTGPAGAAAAPDGGVDTSGVYVADSGFRPDRDGFGFENYTNAGAKNLDAASMRRMFGDAVCAEIQGKRCILTTSAETFLQLLNQAMDGGHCEGLAVEASRLYLGLDEPERYGAKRTVDLKRTVPLERAIAYWWSTQMTEPTVANRRSDLTPNEVVDLLRTGFSAPPGPENTYTLELFTRDGSAGHAITPYAVEDRGNGEMWIMVYDNNFPRQARAVRVDTNTNTWSYASGVNPQAARTEYEGDAETKNLQVTPLAPRLQPQACPFCAGELDDETSLRNQVILVGRGSRDPRLDFYVTDTLGQRLGRIGGKIVEEIPDGKVTRLVGKEGGTGRLAKDSAAPVLSLPATLDGEITVAVPAEMRTTARLELAMVGAGFDVAATDLVVKPGETSQLGFRADGSVVTYRGTAGATPRVVVGTGPDTDPSEDESREVVPVESEADYLIEVQGTKITGESAFGISSDDDDNLLVQTATRGRFDIDLALDRGKRVQKVSLDGVTLRKGDTVRVAILDWKGGPKLRGEIMHTNGTSTPVTFRRPA